MIFTSSRLGIVTIINSFVILPDVNLVVYILCVMDFLKAYITSSFRYLCWGLVNIVCLDKVN